MVVCSRRMQVDIDDELQKTDQRCYCGKVHDIVLKKHVPTAKYMDKCRRCSLIDICQPKAMNDRKLNSYIKGLYCAVKKHLNTLYITSDDAYVRKERETFVVELNGKKAFSGADPLD
jgi:hypothetical protein